MLVCLCCVVGTAFSRSHEDHAGVRFCVDRNMPVGAQSGGSALERQEAGTKESNVSWKWQGCSLTKGVTEDYILPQQENRPLQAQQRAAPHRSPHQLRRQAETPRVVSARGGYQWDVIQVVIDGAPVAIWNHHCFKLETKILQVDGNLRFLKILADVSTASGSAANIGKHEEVEKWVGVHNINEVLFQSKHSNYTDGMVSRIPIWQATPFWWRLLASSKRVFPCHGDRHRLRGSQIHLQRRQTRWTCMELSGSSLWVLLINS